MSVNSVWSRMSANSVCGQECLSIVGVVKNVCHSGCGQEYLSIVGVVKNVCQ